MFFLKSVLNQDEDRKSLSCHAFFQYMLEYSPSALDETKRLLRLHHLRMSVLIDVIHFSFRQILLEKYRLFVLFAVMQTFYDHFLVNDANQSLLFLSVQWT